MSSYYASFSYMGLNSLSDKNLIVVAFDADEGETDAFLEMDPIYTEKSDGSRRHDYGAKFNSVAVIRITVIKSNESDFTVAEVRDFLKWTTGVRKVSYLDLISNGEIKYSFLGRVTSAYQQKMDGRTIGLAIEFTSVSPWAYSPKQIYKYSFDETFTNNAGILNMDNSLSLNVDNHGILYNDSDLFQVTDGGTLYINKPSIISINNQSDDLYTYIGLDTTYVNGNSDYLSIKNTTLNEETIITGISKNETIMLSEEQFIISDIPNKIFGNDFNFIWPRLAPGINEFVISGTGSGSITFVYRYPIKIGDCTMDIDELNVDVCNSACYVDEERLYAMLTETLV